MESLSELINEKKFDRFQNGLKSRFLAYHIEFEFCYKKNEHFNSILINMKKNDTYAIVEAYESGIILFNYSINKIKYLNKFYQCSSEDFHTMIAHSFLYLRDGNFDYHNDWYNNLKKIKE